MRMHTHTHTHTHTQDKGILEASLCAPSVKVPCVCGFNL